MSMLKLSRRLWWYFIINQERLIIDLIHKASQRNFYAQMQGKIVFQSCANHLLKDKDDDKALIWILMSKQAKRHKVTRLGDQVCKYD